MSPRLAMPDAVALRMRALGLCVAAATFFGIAAAPGARGEISVGGTGLAVALTPAVMSDYVFRGISQTRNRWAGQGTVEMTHASGVYIGSFVSNVAFEGTNARQEVDVYAGFRFRMLGTSWDIGAILYTYPGYTQPSGGYDLNYFEVALRASREFGPVKLMGGLFASPDYQLQSGRSLYVEGGMDIQLPFEFLIQGRVGAITMQRNQRFGTPDYLWWSAGIARPLPLGFNATLAYYHTNIARADCVGGQKICDGRVMFSLSRAF